MNKKIVIGIGILVIVVILLGGCIERQKTTTTTTTTISTECGNGTCESGENGFNCPEDCCVSGDGVCPVGCTSENDDDCETGDLSQVKVASVYQKVTDGKLINRSVGDVIGFFKETKTDFIFRGFWIWGPCANKCSDLPPEVLEVHEQKGFDCEKQGYSYTHLKDTTSKIKKEMPDVIFCGAIPAQRINFIEIDPITGKIYNKNEVENMALDPAKWGIIDVSKKQLQKYFQDQGTGGMGYFPDITNPEFQDLVLSWAKKQIDCGADAIWIDALFGQARALEKITDNPNHPAVRESFEETSKIVDEIHRYGQSKGKRIYVGTWWAFVELPYPPPDLDFVTVTPSPEEVSSMHLDESKWDDRLEKIRSKQGDVQIFAFIDWAGTTNTPLGRFSQGLSPDKQREFLKIADEFFQEKGIKFIYPIHGGFMGGSATKLSFGESKVYDSLAPEFETYDTIKELALKKAGTECGNGICESSEDGFNCPQDCCVSGDGLCPAGCTSLNDDDCEREEVLVIAGIPFAESTYRGIPKPSWKEVEEALPALKEAGVDTIYIWAPYEHRFPEPGETITAYTGDGEIELGGLAPCVHIKDYLKPDPERGSEEEFQHMIDKAHSLGIKVIAQLQVTLSTPGDFIYDEHQDWMLESIYGRPAVFWPWDPINFGFIVNKANPEFIDYVAEVVVPHWIQSWGVDGIYLDSPGMAYCDLYIKDLCEEIGYAEGCECLTPVDGYYSPEPLAQAMKAKFETLEAETGRELSFSAEDAAFKTWRDMPDDIIAKACKGNLAYQTDPRIDRSLGQYFEFILGYSFRGLLKQVYTGGEAAYSEKYVEFLKMLDGLDSEYTKIARFVDMWINAHDYIDLLKPDVAGNYITLVVTAPGNVVWMGVYQLPPQSEVSERLFGWDSDILRDWYTKTIKIKREHMALQTDNIENALISPKIKGVMAYNRWDGDESVTVIVNTNNEPVDCTVKTRFDGDKITVYDLLSGEKFEGDSRSLNVEMPAYGSRILALSKTPEVKAETICTDGIDNDGDGLTDNEDGDCWIREGAMTDEFLAYDGKPKTFLEYAEKMPEFKRMGIKTFRLCSICEHVEGKPYPVVDYYKFDTARCVNKEEWACKEELKTLVKTVHDNDMRIVIDFISANAIDESWIYQNHPEWMMKDKEGNIQNCYPSAEWGPALDRANPEVIAFLTEVAGYYMRAYDLDGFWVDAPSSNYNPAIVEGNHEAISLLRSVKMEMLSINPSAVLIAEVSHRGYADSPSVYDNTPVFDEVCECSYGQIFRRFVFPKIITGGMSSEEVVDWLNKEEKVLYDRGRVRFVSAHDRWAGIFPFQHPKLHKPAITLMSTIPSMPMVWMGEFANYTATYNYYEAVLNIRNNNNALKYGSIENVWKSGDNTYAYLREYEDEKVIVVINFLDKTATSYFDLSFLPKGAVLYDELNDEKFTVDNPDNFRIIVPRYGSRILTLM